MAEFERIFSKFSTAEELTGAAGGSDDEDDAEAADREGGDGALVKVRFADYQAAQDGPRAARRWQMRGASSPLSFSLFSMWKGTELNLTTTTAWQCSICTWTAG